MAYPNMAGPTAVLTVYGTGAGTEIPVLGFEFEMHRGEQATMTVRIDNKSGDFGPTCALFDCTNYNTSYVPQRWFQMELRGGQTGVIWRYPMMYQDEHHAVENSNDNVVTIQLVDFSEPLFIGDQMMDDVESTSAATVMAKATIAEILEEYGISHYDLSGYTDHPIAMLHRVGTPMDWIREIIDRMQGWWYFEDDYFILKDGGNWSTASPVDLELTGHEHLTLLNFRRSLQNVFNSAVCQRVDASTALALEFAGEARGTTEDHALDFPCTSAVAQVWAPTAGEVPYDFEWLDAEDNVISTNVTYTGSTPAVAVRFVLEPDPEDDPEYQIPYELYVRGQRENTNAVISANYTATYTHALDQSLNGPRPLRAPITAPTVLDQDDAEDYAERVVIESIISYAQAQVETILDATALPGITVSLTVYRSGLTDYKMLCTGVSHNVELDGDSPSALMILELCSNRQS